MKSALHCPIHDSRRPDIAWQRLSAIASNGNDQPWLWFSSSLSIAASHRMHKIAQWTHSVQQSVVNASGRMNKRCQLSAKRERCNRKRFSLPKDFLAILSLSDFNYSTVAVGQFKLCTTAWRIYFLALNQTRQRPIVVFIWFGCKHKERRRQRCKTCDANSKWKRTKK